VWHDGDILISEVGRLLILICEENDGSEAQRAGIV
jgi:hypothetical protein